MEKLLAEMIVIEFTEKAFTLCVLPGVILLIVMFMFLYFAWLHDKKADLREARKSFGKATKITRATALEMLSQRPEGMSEEVWHDYLSMALYQLSTTGFFCFKGTLYETMKR